MSTAFDTVDIKTLFNIFEHVFNISDECLKWITSYLSNRSQVNNIKSKSFNLSFGVPKGSCIGPIAFLVYISILNEITKEFETNLRRYADDNQTIISFIPTPEDKQRALQNMEKCVKAFRHFLLTHNLLLNDEKAEFLSIGSKQQLNNVDELSLNVGNALIAPFHTAKKLGVIFASQHT